MLQCHHITWKCELMVSWKGCLKNVTKKKACNTTPVSDPGLVRFISPKYYVEIFQIWKCWNVTLWNSFIIWNGYHTDAIIYCIYSVEYFIVEYQCIIHYVTITLPPNQIEWLLNYNCWNCYLKYIWHHKRYHHKMNDKCWIISVELSKYTQLRP